MENPSEYNYSSQLFTEYVKEYIHLTFYPNGFIMVEQKMVQIVSDHFFLFNEIFIA